MSQTLPKILPVNELKNTGKIIKICKESNVPIIITKNGYGEAVLMSLEMYESLAEQLEFAKIVNEGLKDLENQNGAIDGDEFLEKMRSKYGK